jgi:hypothetical protein
MKAIVINNQNALILDILEYEKEDSGLINIKLTVNPVIRISTDSSKTYIVDTDDLEDQKEVEKVVMEDIKNDVNTKLSEFKHVKRILLTTEPMEKTTTQKIKRNIELKKLEDVKL